LNYIVELQEEGKTG